MIINPIQGEWFSFDFVLFRINGLLRYPADGVVVDDFLNINTIPIVLLFIYFVLNYTSLIFGAHLLVVRFN